jgi:hypothetical protein
VLCGVWVVYEWCYVVVEWCYVVVEWCFVVGEWCMGGGRWCMGKAPSRWPDPRLSNFGSGVYLFVLFIAA